MEKQWPVVSDPWPVEANIADEVMKVFH